MKQLRCCAAFGVDTASKICFVSAVAQSFKQLLRFRLLQKNVLRLLLRSISSSKKYSAYLLRTFFRTILFSKKQLRCCAASEIQTASEKCFETAVAQYFKQ